MADREVQRRLAAILASDVAGYTRLMEQDTEGTVGYGELLLDEDGDPLSDEQESFVRVNAQSARHLSDLINQVLDLTKIESGELDTSFSKVDTQDVVRECAHNMADRIAKGQLALLDNTAKNDLSPVWTDAKPAGQSL